MECEHFGKTIDIEKVWKDGKLYTIMKCFPYTDKKEINAGWHRFYVNENAMDWDDAGFVMQCPSYVQHLRDKKPEKKKEK